jgi:membrane protease YdiL (CAAX protease family)
VAILSEQIEYNIVFEDCQQFFQSYNLLRMDSPKERTSLEHVSERRNYNGWCWLSLIFVLLFVLTAFPGTTKREKDSMSTDLDISVKSALAEKAIQSQGTLSTDEIKELIKEVGPERFKTPLSSEVYALMRFELGQSVRPGDVEIIKGVGPFGPMIYKILSSPKLDLGDAVKAEAALPGKTFVGRLLKVDAMAKANDLGPRNLLFASLKLSREIEGGAISVVFFGGVIAWAFFLQKWLKGEIKFEGLPNLPPTKTGADQLAIRAAIVFGAYIVLMLVFELIASLGKSFAPILQIAGGLCTALFPSIVLMPVFELIASLGKSFAPILQIAGGLCTIALFPLILISPVGGIPVTLSSLGLGRNSPWSRWVRIGFFVFLLEFPLTALMSYVGDKIFPNETKAHPAVTMLVNSHSPIMIVALLLLASLQAPLFEETIFRGLMLPAVVRVTGSLALGIGITSFLFASIHPQGLGAWLGLSTVAAASCMSLYYTRSLGPSIVMHAVHNAVTLCFVLLLT